MTRTFKQRVASALIGVMLFAQMAVAAYACPGLSSAVGQARQAQVAVAAMDMAAADENPAPPSARTAQGAMDCDHMAAAMDKTSPNLCAQHCHDSQQSDQASTLTVPAVLLTPLYVLAPPSEAMQLLPSTGSRAGAFAAVSPPHSILHCCFRV